MNSSARVATNERAAPRCTQVPRGSSRSAEAVPTTYTRVKAPVIISRGASSVTPLTAITARLAIAPAVTTPRERRGTAPVVPPRASQIGSDPSRASAAPRRAPPAK